MEFSLAVFIDVKINGCLIMQFFNFVLIIHNYILYENGDYKWFFSYIIFFYFFIMI